MHVIFFHTFTHCPDSRHLFRFWHGQCLQDRISHLFTAVRIDNQCFWQFAGCPGHFAEDQHTVILSACCHVFFGNQVHPVAQRGDQSDVSHRIERTQRLQPEVFVQVGDRRPTDIGEPSIDPAHQFVDLATHVLIFVDADP